MVLAIISLSTVGVLLFVLTAFDLAGGLLPAFTNLAVILTLAALLAYVYYTHELAREAWLASASLVLEQVPRTTHFLCIVTNHSKRSIECWCRLNASVYGQAVELGGFYSAEHPFEAAPFGQMRGHFDIADLLQKAGRTLEQARTETPERAMKDRLSLDVELWYQAHGSKAGMIRNPRQPYYFDFKRNALVFDR